MWRHLHDAREADVARHPQNRQKRHRRGKRPNPDPQVLRSRKNLQVPLLPPRPVLTLLHQQLLLLS